MHLLRRMTVLCLLGSVAFGWDIMASVGTAASDTDAYPSIAATLELMQGHLIASLENFMLGQTPLAQVHAAHPLHEHYRNLPAGFAKDHRDLDKLLQDTLARLPQILSDKVDIETYATQVQGAARLLEQVGIILIPAEIRTTLTFQAAVLIHLLEEIAEEYAEAVKDAKVVNLPEYQDAFGFLQRARTLGEPVAAQMKIADRQHMQALRNALEEAIPGIMPPTSPKSSQAVERHIASLVTLLRGVKE
jgi:hypothetical protein